MNKSENNKAISDRYTIRDRFVVNSDGFSFLAIVIPVSETLVLKAPISIILAGIIAKAAKTVSAAATQNNDDKNNPDAAAIIVSKSHVDILSPRYVFCMQIIRAVIIDKAESVEYSQRETSGNESPERFDIRRTFNNREASH
jgi:hypothetical protein